MRIAAIETSSRVTSVAIIDQDRIASRRHDAPRGHVELCVPTLLDLCGEAGIGLADLDAIAVGRGPGLFTGLRVGVQTAKTLAAMLERPLIALSSLEILAAGPDPRTVCACVNAHRGEVFAALFQDGDRITDDAVMTPADTAALARAHDAVVVGDGVRVAPDVFTGVETREGFPDAAVLARLATRRMGDAADPRTLEPAYLRRSDAEIRWGDTGVVALRPDRVRVKGTR